MKNLRTPRTLADSSFETGYSAAQIAPRRDRVAGYVLAVVIGVALTLTVIYGGRP